MFAILLINQLIQITFMFDANLTEIEQTYNRTIIHYVTVV